MPSHKLRHSRVLHRPQFHTASGCKTSRRYATSWFAGGAIAPASRKADASQSAKAAVSTAPKSAPASKKGSGGKSEVNTKALFLVSRGGKSGYINGAANIVINIEFDSAGEFAEGLAAVKVGGNGATSVRPGRSSLLPSLMGRTLSVTVLLVS